MAYTSAVGEYAAWIMEGVCTIIEPETVPVQRLAGYDRGWHPLDIDPRGPCGHLRTDRRSSYGKPDRDPVSIGVAPFIYPLPTEAQTEKEVA
jgi:hypothetical protein